MLSYFLQMLYGMADLYMMGQFSGAAGITAVGNGAQTLYIITVTLVGLAMGTTVIVGHAVGSRRFDRAETVIGNTITLFMGVSVVLAVVLLALCPQVVALIGTPPEAVEGTAAYLRICFVGIPFIAAYNILSAIFRGLGDSRSPMYVIGVACIINIALDFLFIGHMGLGPVGAALGTVTAQTASVALALVWLKSRRTNIHVKRSDLRPQPEVLGSILKIGVPVAVQDGCIQVAFMFITVIANHRGLVDAAAVGLVEKMISFLFIVPSSMGATVSALTAQNAGAGKGDRARQVLKDAMTISLVYGCLITVLMWLPAPAICAAIFSTQSLPASTFALAAFSLRMARATSALRTTCWPWRSFACPVHGCYRMPIPTRCFPWASLRRADRFCRQLSVLSRLPCSTGAGLLTSWWRSGTTRNRPHRRYHQRRPHNLRDADHGAGCPVQIRTAQKTFG
jgi:putative MATE family efflux protein